MNTLKMLGLDDDNHGYCWVCEDGTTFSTTEEAMEFLAKPHDYQVELKLFAIVDEWSDKLSTHDECEVYHMFDFLEDITRAPEGMTFNEIFKLFWDSANLQWW